MRYSLNLIRHFRTRKNLERVWFRVGLWDRHWGNYSFSSFVLSSVMIPQATANESRNLDEQLAKTKQFQISHIRILVIGLELACNRGSCGERLMSFAFEKTPRISLGCKLVPGQNWKYECGFIFFHQTTLKHIERHIAHQWQTEFL